MMRLASTSLCLALAFSCAAPTDTDDPVDPGAGGTGGTAPATGGTGTGGTAPTGGTGGAVASGGTGGTGGAGGSVSAGSGGATGGAAPTGGTGGAAVAGAGGSVTAGSGGAVATGGMASGAAAGAPATGGAGGMDAGGTAGAGASGGTSSGTMPCPDGCAVLTVPFTAYNTSQSFEIYLPDPAVDLSAATIAVSIRKLSGKAGGLQVIVKNGSAQNYAYAQGAWTPVNDMTTAFATVTLDVANPSSTDMNNPFDPAQIKIITLQISAGDPWYSDTAMTVVDPTALVNPTVLQVDSITITGTGTYPGPYPFTANAMPLQANVSADALAAMPPYAVTGSTVAWQGP